MIEEVWDGAPFNEAERDHLSLCEVCRRQLAGLTLLHDEIQLARLSQMSPEAENNLIAIFLQARQDAANEKPLQPFLGALTGWVNALPRWDSRQQAGSLGIRNASMSGYRLLYGVNETGVELMVEPHHGLLRVVGEVIVGEQGGQEGTRGLALVELMASANPRSAHETESDANGRFVLEQVPPGVYTLTITPRFSQMVVIEALELT
jgi:hypothetical protein